jgi:hypothetical protein
MTDLLRTVATYFDASYPPDILAEPPVPPIPATGATEVVGGPGDFTPSGCDTPSRAQLTSNPVVASPLTAWSTGSHVVATDGNAYWDGTAWVNGIAAAAPPPPPPAGRRRNGGPAPEPAPDPAPEPEPEP